MSSSTEDYCLSPQEWKIQTISQLSDTYAGGTPSRNANGMFGGSIPWVKSAELNQSEIYNTEEKLTELGYRSSSARWVPENTPLIAMYGATAGVVSWLRIRAVTNQAVLAVPPRSQQTDARWLYWILLFYSNRLIASVQGSGQPNLNKSLIEKLQVAQPCWTEQRLIAEILDTIDETIAHTKALIQKLKQIKAGLLHDLLTRGLDENGELRDAIAQPEQFKDSPLGRIPKDWDVSGASFEFDITTGFTLGEHRRPRYNKRRYLRVANVQREKVLLDDIAELEAGNGEIVSRLLEEDDLLIVEGHANPYEIGRCALVPAEAVGLTFQNHLFRLRCKRLNPRFALAWLNSEWVRAYWRCLCGTSSGLNTINRTQLNALPVAVPEKKEQSRIVATINAYNTRIYTEEAYLDKLKLQKQGLMHDLLTGKVRVNEIKQ